MGDKSLIEWTDATWNPITGCSVVSPGCTNCYAMTLAGTRLRHHPTRAGLTVDSKAGPVWTGEVRFNERQLLAPLAWSRARMIFVCAHGDLFHESVPDEWIDRVFAVMAMCPQHTFQCLSKRPERMRVYMTGDRSRILDAVFELAADARGDVAGLVARENAEARGWPLANVWLGSSVEDQRRADERIPELLATPAAVRFISAEPLLGPVDLVTARAIAPRHLPMLQPDSPLCDDPFCRRGGPHYPREFGCRWGREPTGLPGLDWVIVGGERGRGARPMHPDWARSLRDQCATAGVPFFFKQWGDWLPFYDRDRDDPDWRAVPKVDNQMGRGAERHVNLEGGCGFHGARLVAMRNVGKKAAGRLLDGVEHNGMPQVAA